MLKNLALRKPHVSSCPPTFNTFSRPAAPAANPHLAWSWTGLSEGIGELGTHLFSSSRSRCLTACKPDINTTNSSSTQQKSQSEAHIGFLACPLWLNIAITGSWLISEGSKHYCALAPLKCQSLRDTTHDDCCTHRNQDLGSKPAVRLGELRWHQATDNPTIWRREI